jgi:hypothetical protein
MKSGPTLFIESTDFTIEPGEDRPTNPGIYGRALAHWIAAGLRASGREVGEPIAEDFGWCVPLGGAPFPLYVACANDEGAADTWATFVFAEPSFWQSLFARVDTAPALAAATDVLRTLLRDAPGVTRLWEERRA